MIELEPYKWTIQIISKTHCIDPNLIGAIIMQESHGDKFARRYEPAFAIRYAAETIDDKSMAVHYSKATELNFRAVSWGLMQIMGLVARENGFKGDFIKDLLDPSVNIHYGTKHLVNLIKRKGGDEVRGILAYNGGGEPSYPERIEKWRDGLRTSRFFEES